MFNNVSSESGCFPWTGQRIGRLLKMFYTERELRSCERRTRWPSRQTLYTTLAVVSLVLGSPSLIVLKAIMLSVCT